LSALPPCYTHLQSLFHYTTQERVLKDSAKWYREVIRRNGIADPGQSEG
jgi:beta-glucosidase/6-phospho-beta-glucosidase/beta-galactosidase